MTAKKLTPKQAAFCSEYLLDLNATQAAIRAGYSVKTAQEQGSRLLCNVMVAESVAVGMKKQSDKAQLGVDDLCEKLTDIIKGDDMEARTSDRLRAIELLGKHFGMFNKIILAGDADNPLIAAPKLDLSGLSDAELETVLNASAKIAKA